MTILCVSTPVCTTVLVPGPLTGSRSNRPRSANPFSSLSQSAPSPPFTRTPPGGAKSPVAGFEMTTLSDPAPPFTVTFVGAAKIWPTPLTDQLPESGDTASMRIVSSPGVPSMVSAPAPYAGAAAASAPSTTATTAPRVLPANTGGKLTPASRPSAGSLAAYALLAAVGGHELLQGLLRRVLGLPAELLASPVGLHQHRLAGGVDPRERLGQRRDARDDLGGRLQRGVRYGKGVPAERVGDVGHLQRAVGGEVVR